MPRPVSLLRFTLLPALLALAGNAFAAPFEPDAETLLLAHFDQRPDRADYANGWDAFGGGGYSSIDGYYGKGVDLRGLQRPGNIWKAENTFPPRYTQWIFWPRGNVSFKQGTLEFWFRPGAANTRHGSSGGDLLHFQHYQPLRPEMIEKGPPPKYRHFQPYIRLNPGTLSWMLVTLKGDTVQGRVDFARVEGWKRKLDPDQWHHFALQWSPEGITLHLDGRLVGSHVLEGDFGLALTGPTQRGLALNSVVLDELRISARPRYGAAFEPAWREGSRPADAFPGVPETTPITWKPHLSDLPLASSLPASEPGPQRKAQLGPWGLRFEETTGRLAAVQHESLDLAAGRDASGLLLWQGTERTPLAPKKASAWKADGEALAFEQQWGDSLQTRHRLAPGKSGEIVWEIDFRNDGSTPLWLEALLSLPVMKETTGFFDMSWSQEKLPFPRRRDEWLFSLPMTAASDGTRGIGVGLDPHQGVSALIGEWLPAHDGGNPSIRQGTRVALAPGESQSLRFVLFRSKGEFGVLDSLAAYHALFPDLYRLQPSVPIYSYLGVCQYFSYVHLPDLTRTYYSGGQWGHGPYHTKGDYLGSPRFWGRKDLADRPDYQHAAGNERLYRSRENLHRTIVERSRDSFEQYYTPRRSHDVPNLAARFIVEELMPGIEFPDDPLTAGQYFAPKNLVVNEFNTPLGAHFMNDQKGVMELIARWSPGFINDFCQASSFRFNDRYARKSPGRAFSADRGEYVVGALGHAERYRMINAFETGGKHQSMISDWGMISYILSAWSAANTFESGDPFVSTTGMKIGLAVSRNLLGEKPISVLTSYGHDDIGKVFKPEDFTPESLRDEYRFTFRRLMLAALETGYYVDPPLLHGKQWNSEVNPILVESLVGGRKTIPGGRVNEPLWLVRGGEEAKSVVVVGNRSAQERKTPLSLLHAYLGGRFLWAPYNGGEAAQRVTDRETRLPEVALAPHDIAAYKPVAELLDAEADRAAARWEGDGLEIRVQIDLNVKSDGALRLLCPAEYYEVAAIRLNGKPFTPEKENRIPLPGGAHRIEATLRNRVLQFDAAAWNQVELIENNTPRFCLLAATQPGYEAGTAAQFNWFLLQYDEEDGIPGNLPDAPVYASENEIPEGFTGWAIDLRPTPDAKAPAVHLDPATRRIRVVGSTPGEVRRAVMLLLRLVDRRYPHIGRHVPLDRNLKSGWKIPGWTSTYNPDDPGWKRLYKRSPDAIDFYTRFANPAFLSSPILEKEYEPLYENGNLDFAGKYRLRAAPYLFEPTWAESYVYGYAGPRSHPSP
ncbi:MAG TPA: hypothetical protein VNQ90_01710 [Chthoniobacteraceae bacterium]|nr:hypothetical protein [Chthoniobacteraceae bacterium]